MSDQQKQDLRDFQRQAVSDHLSQCLRALRFAVGLPPEADAHYAGKGISQGNADTPIFWYRPKDAEKYRVIYADLSVHEADVPPSVPNAQPMPAQSSSKQ